jgi:hypothetical protein
MGLEMLFLTAVLGIAGIHLLSNLVNFLVKTLPTRDRVSHKEKASDDWYAFFKKSDLYGDMANTAIEPELVREDAAESILACEDACQPQEAYT